MRGDLRGDLLFVSETFPGIVTYDGFLRDPKLAYIGIAERLHGIVYKGYFSLV